MDENRFQSTKHLLLNWFCFWACITAYLVMARECASILVQEGAGQINYHLKQNEPTIHDSHIIKLVRCACIFRGQLIFSNILTVAGVTMILFSLQNDRLFLALYFVLVHATRLK